MATTASPAVSSTIGLKNVVIAPLTTDTETECTYGTVQAVAGAIEATVTPDNTDPDVQYADDIEFDVLYPDPKVSFSLKMADLPLAIQEMLFSNAIDDNGVLVRKAADKPCFLYKREVMSYGRTRRKQPSESRRRRSFIGSERCPFHRKLDQTAELVCSRQRCPPERH